MEPANPRVQLQATDYCGCLKSFTRGEVIIEHDNRVDGSGRAVVGPGTGHPLAETRITVRQLCEGRVFIFQNK